MTDEELYQHVPVDHESPINTPIAVIWVKARMVEIFGGHCKVMEFDAKRPHTVHCKVNRIDSDIVEALHNYRFIIVNTIPLSADVMLCRISYENC